MDDQAFNNYLTNVRTNAASDVQAPQQMQQQQTPAPQQQGSGGNWLTHLLPTAGSLGGGLGGASLGASIGSVVPGIGTAIGGVAGGILGAAFGGGGGKAAENATEGKDIGHDVGTAAVEGGVGQAVGGIAGKALGKGAEFLANRATGITKAATDTAEHAAVDKAAADTAAAIKNNYGGIKPNVQSSNNLAGNQKLLQEWGLDHTDPQAMADASKGGLFIHGIDEAALGAGKPIKTTDLISSKDITTAAPAEQQALVKAGIITPEGALPTHVTPVQANKFAQDLNGQVRDLQATMTNAKANGRVADYTAAKEQYSNLNGLYKNVQNLSASPGVNESIVARTISPEEKQQLVEQLGQGPADHIEQAVNNAKSHQDLVNAKLPFAQMNELSSQALQDLKATATPRAVARNKMDINGDGTADVAPASTNIPTLASDLGSAHGVLGKSLVLGKHAATNPTILNTLSRMGGLLSKAAPAAGVVAGTAPNLAADPVAAQPQQDGTMGAAMQPAQQNPLGDLYQTLLQNYQAGGGITPNDASTAGTLATLAPAVQKQNLASTELSALPGAFANAGGAQGEGGILSHIAGLIPGTAAHTYQQQQAGAAQALAAQLGISPQAAMGLLPQLMQSQQTAGQSQGVLGQLQGQLAY
jgi:hypothetical protein